MHAVANKHWFLYLTSMIATPLLTFCLTTIEWANSEDGYFNLWQECLYLNITQCSIDGDTKICSNALEEAPDWLDVCRGMNIILWICIVATFFSSICCGDTPKGNRFIHQLAARSHLLTYLCSGVAMLSSGLVYAILYKDFYANEGQKEGVRPGPGLLMALIGGVVSVTNALYLSISHDTGFLSYILPQCLIDCAGNTRQSQSNGSDARSGSDGGGRNNVVDVAAASSGGGDSGSRTVAAEGSGAASRYDTSVSVNGCNGGGGRNNTVINAGDAATDGCGGRCSHGRGNAVTTTTVISIEATGATTIMIIADSTYDNSNSRSNDVSDDSNNANSDINTNNNNDNRNDDQAQPPGSGNNSTHTPSASTSAQPKQPYSHNSGQNQTTNNNVVAGTTTNENDGDQPSFNCRIACETSVEGGGGARDLDVEEQSRADYLNHDIIISSSNNNNNSDNNESASSLSFSGNATEQSNSNRTITADRSATAGETRGAQQQQQQQQQVSTSASASIVEPGLRRNNAVTGTSSVLPLHDSRSGTSPTWPLPGPPPYEEVGLTPPPSYEEATRIL